MATRKKKQPEPAAPAPSVRGPVPRRPQEQVDALLADAERARAAQTDAGKPSGQAPDS